MTRTILLALTVLCLTSCGDDVNPVSPSKPTGVAVTRSGDDVELCADPLTRRRPC